MLDSNSHNDSDEKGESVMGKVMEQSKEQIHHYEEKNRLLYQVYKVSGIHPADYESVNQYLEAVLRSEDSDTLKDFGKITNSSWFCGIIESELKKRGELS